MKDGLYRRRWRESAEALGFLCSSSTAWNFCALSVAKLATHRSLDSSALTLIDAVGRVRTRFPYVQEVERGLIAHYGRAPGRAWKRLPSLEEIKRGSIANCRRDLAWCAMASILGRQSSALQK